MAEGMKETPMYESYDLTVSVRSAIAGRAELLPLQLHQPHVAFVRRHREEEPSTVRLELCAARLPCRVGKTKDQSRNASTQRDFIELVA